jgi:hypothetical protein
VLTTLRPHLNVVWQALEDGARAAQEYLEQFPSKSGRRLCPYTFPVLVRLHAKQQLEATFAGEIDDEEDETIVGDLPSNGLHLRTGPYSMRIRMSDDGLLPVPGSSKVLRRFYDQPLDADLFGDNELVSELRLMVLWERTKKGVLGLDLVCPKTGGASRTDVSEHWRIPIPHPAFGVEVSAASISPVHDDLDLYDTPLPAPAEKRGTASTDAQ